MSVKNIKHGKRLPYGVVQRVVMTREDLSVHSKALYALLQSYIGRDDEYCFPSLNTMAKSLKISKTTVVKYLNELIEKGIVRKEQQLTKKGQVNNRYFVLELYEEVVHEVNRGSAGGEQGVVQEVNSNKEQYSNEQLIKEKIKKENEVQSELPLNTKQEKEKVAAKEKEEHPLQKFIRTETDLNKRIPQKITHVECEKLLGSHPKKIIHEVLMNLHNRKKLDYRNQYLTIHNWCKRNKLFKEQSNPEQPKRLSYSINTKLDNEI